jgi:hypothetical protein
MLINKLVWSKLTNKTGSNQAHFPSYIIWYCPMSKVIGSLW